MFRNDGGFLQVLGDLEKKEEDLKRTITEAQRDLAEIQIAKKHVRAVADARGVQSPKLPDPADGAETSPNAPYRGMSNPDAALAFLKQSGKPHKTAAIGQALKRGGLRSAAKDFNATMFGTLRRLEQDGRVVKVGMGMWRIANPETSDELEPL